MFASLVSLIDGNLSGSVHLQIDCGQFRSWSFKVPNFNCFIEIGR